MSNTPVPAMLHKGYPRSYAAARILRAMAAVAFLGPICCAAIGVLMHLSILKGRWLTMQLIIVFLDLAAGGLCIIPIANTPNS